MTVSKSVRVAFATVATALLVAAAQYAWGFNHENKLTFGYPVALPGVTLPAGTYLFDVASPTALDVVVVRSVDRRKTYYTGFTAPVLRPPGMSPNVPITFGEAPATAPHPIAVWYELGWTAGHQFLYR